MAQNSWQQEWIIVYHILRFEYMILNMTISVFPLSEPPILSHIQMSNSLSLALFPNPELYPLLRSMNSSWTPRKQTSYAKSLPKQKPTKTPSCNEFEQTTKPFLPACGLLMIHDIPADKWIFQTCLPLSMQTTHPVPLMQYHFCMDIPWKEKHLLRLFQTTLKRIYQRLHNGLLCKVLLALRCPLCNCSTKTHGRPSILRGT